jgi:hypothetical protein
MKSKKLHFLFLATIAATISATAQTNILPVKGLEADHQGICAWNVTGTKVGHAIPVPYNDTWNEVAYYYIATRDVNNFDPSATTGMHGTGSLTGFYNLAAALGANGKTISDINIRMATTTLGGDVQGSDWSMVGAVESRKYTAGSYAILLNNDTLVTGDMPELNLNINYNTIHYPYDDQTSGYTNYSTPALYASSGIANTIATAFLNDIGSYKIRLVFSSIQPAGQTEFGSLGGTFGGFFVIQTGQIETGSIATQTTKVIDEDQLQIYPSSVQSNLQIKFGKNGNFKSLTIVNILGEELITKQINQNTEQLNLDLGSLHPGIYFCIVYDENGESLSRKFIKI